MDGFAKLLWRCTYGAEHIDPGDEFEAFVAGQHFQDESRSRCSFSHPNQFGSYDLLLSGSIAGSSGRGESVGGRASSQGGQRRIASAGEGSLPLDVRSEK